MRSVVFARSFALAIAVLVSSHGAARAQPAAPLSDESILGPSTNALHVESVTTRVTGFDQFGHGYQSQAGPAVSGPGSERLTVFEPQVEIVATQGDRLTHRIMIPVDVITNASPNSIAPPDVQSGASRRVESGTIDWSTTYKASPVLDASMRSGIHLENPFRSWYAGLGASRSFAEQNTVVGGNVLAIFDWFDQFDIHGGRHGRTQRSTSTGSLSFSQVLSPTTVAAVNYGLTVQRGELGNTWNSVPLEDGTRGPELLPPERVRHALIGRMAQFLPWNGALRLYYRFYADDWGIVAHSVEGLLNQRISPEIYVGFLYRFHTQTAPTFFTIDAPLDDTRRVADSDLAPLQSETVGGKVVGDVPLRGGPFRSLHVELEYDRYIRTNDLTVDIVSCALGWRF